MTNPEIELKKFFGDTPVPDNVIVGADCLLEFVQNAFQKLRELENPAMTLGDRVRVHMWSAFGCGPKGVIRVGDDSVLVGAQFMCENKITIGRRVVVSYNVTIVDLDFSSPRPRHATSGRSSQLARR